MNELLTITLVFLVGVIAAVMGTLVGGGGLLSIPFLIFVGLPPQMAIATDRLASLGQIITALWTFAKSDKIRWSYIPIFSVLSLIGSFLGVYILFSIDEGVIKYVIGGILLCLLPLVMLSKDLGVKRSKSTKLKIAIGLALYVIVQTYAGFFGGGSGTLIIYVCMFFFGFSIIEVNATGLIPWSLIAISSSIIFIQKGLVDYVLALALFIGMAVGGYFGAKIALKKGDLWVKKLFAILVVVMAIKLLFF